MCHACRAYISLLGLSRKPLRQQHCSSTSNIRAHSARCYQSHTVSCLVYTKFPEHRPLEYVANSYLWPHSYASKAAGGSSWTRWGRCGCSKRPKRSWWQGASSREPCRCRLSDIVRSCQVTDQISLQLAAEAASQYDKLSSDNEGLASTRSAHDNVAAATSKAIQDQVDKQAESLSKEQSK